MRISVSVVASDVEVTQDLIALEVFPEMSLESVKGFVQEEISVPPTSQHFLVNSQPVANTTQSLEALGVSEGDVLSLVIRSGPPPTQRSAPNPRVSNTRRRAEPPSREFLDAEATRLQLLSDSALLEDVRNNDPELAHFVNDPDRFREVFHLRQQRQLEAQKEKEEMMALLDSDQFNPDAQKKIEELIRQERVMENMKKALDENPESFGRVTMLYIDVTVNDVPIKAFVDSGAQTTIMSPDAAEKCGIMRLIDRRFGGMARGVGTAVILGRVHSADIQIGQYNLASSFTVMEGKGVDLLLGLDMLKRHQMCIDLKDNVLRIQNDSIPFLAENEIPKDLDAALENEATLKGPGGTEIGASSGTVKPMPAQSQQQSASRSSASTASGSGTTIHPPGAAGNVLATQQPGAAQPSTSPLPPGVTEQAIAQIVGLGFSRQEAIGALQRADGNVEYAIGYLI